MKLAFMTWVCPEWTVEEIIEFGAETPYDGVELRVNADHAHGVDADATPEERAAVRERFAAAGLELPCVATSHQFAVADASEREETLAAAKANVELAGDLGADYLRVFAGGDGESMTDAAADRTAAALTDVGEFGRDHGVRPLLETKHDIVETAADAVAVLERVETPNAGALWNRSTIDEAALDALGERIEHVHVHDEVLDPGNENVGGLAAALSRTGYDGYVSLEIIEGENLPRETLAETGERLSEQLKTE